MSCLPAEALFHFEQREAELLALNKSLETKREKVVAEASNAAQGAVAAAEAATPNLLSRASVTEETHEYFSPGIGPPIRSAMSSRPPSGSGVRVASPFQLGDVFSQQGGDALHTTIRFQGARIIALQEELDKTLKEASDREAENQSLRQSLNQTQDELLRLQKTGDSSEKQQNSLKKQFGDAEAKIKLLEQEKADLTKESNQISLQQRRLEAESSAKEARLNRMAEENEKYKLALKDAGSHDRDRANADRRESERLQTEVRKLERQRAELVNAFKKQMKLIEVLKRQRAHLEAARVLAFSEEEFIRILELGDKLGE